MSVVKAIFRSSRRVVSAAAPRVAICLGADMPVVERDLAARTVETSGAAGHATGGASVISQDSPVVLESTPVLIERQRVGGDPDHDCNQQQRHKKSHRILPSRVWHARSIVDGIEVASQAFAIPVHGRTSTVTRLALHNPGL